MFLQEEYIQRHSLDIPLIVYTNFGNIIFKHQDFRHLLMRLEWQHCNWRVGNFKIWIYSPIHNSYNDKLFSLYDDIEIEWNNYSSFFTSWVPLWRDEIIPLAQYDSFAACWEVFLYCFDGWLARNASPELMKLIDKTSDPLDAYRIRNIHNAYDYLKLNYPSIAKKFSERIFPFSTGYMNWLVDLFKNNIEKSKLSC